jgi:hypothetical protein
LSGTRTSFALIESRDLQFFSSPQTFLTNPHDSNDSNFLFFRNLFVRHRGVIYPLAAALPFIFATVLPPPPPYKCDLLFPLFLFN